MNHIEIKRIYTTSVPTTVWEFKILKADILNRIDKLIKKLEDIRGDIDATEIDIDENSMRDDIIDCHPELSDEEVELKLYEQIEAMCKEKFCQSYTISE